jgi:hypothetical protein
VTYANTGANISSIHRRLRLPERQGTGKRRHTRINSGPNYRFRPALFNGGSVAYSRGERCLRVKALVPMTAGIQREQTHCCKAAMYNHRDDGANDVASDPGKISATASLPDCPGLRLDCIDDAGRITMRGKQTRRNEISDVVKHVVRLDGFGPPGCSSRYG